MGKNVHRLETDAQEKVQMSYNDGHSINHSQLCSIVERIERLEDEHKNIKDDIKEVYGEAKSNGYDCKIIKRIIKEKATDQDVLAEQEILMDIYRRALGLTPLERYAADQEERCKISISVQGITYDIDDAQRLFRAKKVTDDMIVFLQQMQKMGGFRPVTEGDKRLTEKFIELKLLKHPNKSDDLYLLTAKGEKLSVGDK